MYDLSERRFFILFPKNQGELIRNRKSIVSLQIDTGKFEEFIEHIISLATNKTSSYICVANVHMTIEAYDNKTFADLVNNADLICPDGMPLAKGIQLLYKQKQDRVAGMDLLPLLLKKSEEDKIPVYFYGGSEQMLQKTKLHLQQFFPEIICAGMYSPPFRKLTVEEEFEINQNIINSKAQLVFVALGCPKQEMWMAKNSHLFNASLIGIGGALPVMIGEQKRAPMWMQRLSLEWLFRFLQEPRRLFKRYFYTNSKFIFLLTLQYFMKNKRLK